MRILLCIVFLPLAALAQEDIAASYAGRPVAEILESFRIDGTNFAYSTNLVTPDLLVVSEPELGEPLEIALQILRPHGLTIRTESGVHLVIRAQQDEVEEPEAEQQETMTAEIESISVTASRYEILRETGSSRFNLDQRSIQNMPDVGEDPIRAVQRLPGAAASGASAKTHFRGGEASEIGVMLNGQRLFDPYHIRDYQSIFSTIDARAIEGVEVYTGGFPAMFGNRMSGMVLMESLDSVEPRHTEVGVSVFNTSVLTAGKESDRSWVFSARRGNLDLVINSDFGSPSYYDVFGDYTWDLSDRMTISVNGLFADDSVELILETEPDELERVVSETKNGQLWVTLDNRWSEELSSRTVISGLSFDNRRNGSLNDEEKIVAMVSDDRRVRQVGLRQDFAYQSNDKHFLQWGLQIDYSDAEYDYQNEAEYFGLQAAFINQPPTSSLDLTATPKGSSYALYFSDRWKLSEVSSLEWGLRFDDQTYTDVASDAQLSPRLSYQRTLGEDTYMQLSWGRYHQSQEINELQIEDGITNFWKAQRADHFIAGLRHRFENDLSLRAELFYKDVDDVRPRFENLFDPLGLIPEVQPDRIRLDPQSAESMGMELSIERSTGPYHWWATYVLSEATDRIDDKDELRSWDQRHAFQGGASWSNRAWDIAAAVNVHSGWPLTELTLNEDGFVVPGGRNAYRHDTFASLDIRIARTWQLKRGKFMAFLEVSNATNRGNACCLDFDLEEDEDTGEIELERGVDNWLPLLPAVGVLWTF